MTECSGGCLGFQGHGGRSVVAAFDGGAIASDGGALLLREVEARTGILAQFAACFEDHRQADRIEHTVAELIAQRVYGLALGYEDLNDHDELRADPLLALLAGKADLSGADRRVARDRGKALAGKSTLNRLELTRPEATAAQRYKKIVAHDERIADLFVAWFLQAYERPPQRIVLDPDATDTPLHGAQEGRFFHGYYHDYCYLPLYVFCGDHLLCAKLRTANRDAADGALEELRRIVERIRQAWPETQILIRADSGFCRDEIMAWCEETPGVDYLLGLARNARLQATLAPRLAEAKALYEETGRAARVFTEFAYRTHKSWSRARRVIAKAEHLAKGANPRFVVTSLSAEECDARTLYEQEYCARGEMENRIKEQQLDMFADRLSATAMRANQLRLSFAAVAYTLMQTLRRLGLRDTQMARAQCGTIRLKLLKIGARVRLSARRIALSFASACPYQTLFAQALQNIHSAAIPLRC